MSKRRGTQAGRSVVEIEHDVHKLASERAAALAKFRETLQGAESEAILQSMENTYDNKMRRLQEELEDVRGNKASRQEPVVEFQSKRLCGTDGSEDSGKSSDDESYGGGGGGEFGEEWMPSTEMKDTSEHWEQSPLMLILRSLQSGKKGTACGPQENHEYSGQVFHTGRCYLYRHGDQSIMVGIKGFCPQSDEAECVLVAPFAWTFMGYDNQKVKYKAKHKPADKFRIEVNLQPLRLAAFGNERLDHIPEWVFEPPMKGSPYNFAYFKTGKRKQLGLRENIRVEEMFAGCGGMAQGFHQSGFETVLAVEKNKKAATAYRLNYPTSKMECMDIKELGRNFGGECEHNHGSCPCQAFSRMNVSGGKNDEANAELTPVWAKSVVTRGRLTASYENVPGLWDYEWQPYLREMVDEFLGNGYQVRVCLLRACDYGDPQNRPRLFLLAARECAYLPSVPPRTHGPGTPLPYVTVRDALSTLKPCELKSEELGRDIEHRLEPDEPAKTLIASKKPPYHYEWNRRLTIEEMAALFSYPPGYHFVGRPKDQIRQIGNSVPVMLAYAVAEAFKRVLRYKYEGE